MSGANSFFVRNEFESQFTAYKTEELYQPPRYWLAGGSCGHPSSWRWLKQELRSESSQNRNNTIKGSTNREIIKISLSGLPEFPFEIHTKFDQFISYELARDKIWEPFETSVFRRICREGDFVLDIGANIGWYSTLASFLVGKTGCVWAYEPDPENYEILNRNIQRCGATNVRAVRAALGATIEEVDLYLSPTNLGDHRLFNDGSVRASVRVKVDTVDHILSESNKLPSIIKSDTQGSEGLIVRGASHFLATGWRPVWLLEFWPFGLRKSDTDPMELVAHFCELRYRLFEVSESNPKLV